MVVITMTNGRFLWLCWFNGRYQDHNLNMSSNVACNKRQRLFAGCNAFVPNVRVEAACLALRCYKRWGSERRWWGCRSNFDRQNSINPTRRGCSSHDIENIPTTNKKLPTTKKSLTFSRGPKGCHDSHDGSHGIMV